MSPISTINMSYNTVQSATIRKTHRMHLVTKDDIQGDTGANCSATNNRDILWNYKELETPIKIVTYQGDHENRISHNLEAIGTGLIKMVIKDTTLSWLTLYTPNSTGTIISPDRFMMDNGHVEEFQHIGKRDGQGHIIFKDKNNHTLAQIDMTRSRDGLWFVDHQIYYPPEMSMMTITLLRQKSTPPWPQCRTCIKAPLR
jgi:hypothetical protein